MKKILFISLLISSTFAGAVSLEGSCLVQNTGCSPDEFDAEAMTSTTSPLTYLVMDSESIQDAEVTGALLVQEAFDEESDMKTTISVANELEIAPKHIQNAVVELFEAGEAVTVENIESLL